jgi:hypothetical protein
MQVTLELPDDIQSLTPEQQREKIVMALQAVKNTKAETNLAKKKSKWSEIVQKIEGDPVHLAGYSGQLKKDMNEFRENFEFKHDQ